MKSMNSDINGSNWLGFSLSPNPSVNHQFSHQELVPYANCYNVGENGVFHSPLTVMPLKSDGSLCIMEALSRSHSEVMASNPSPKLEDFLGVSTHNHYGNSSQSDAMVLSLDHATFYNQEVPLIRNHYYSGIDTNQMYETPNNTQIEEENPCFKTWINNQAINDTNIGTNNHMGCGDLQSLSLSMSPGSQSSCVTAQNSTTDCVGVENKKRGSDKMAQKTTVHRKSIDTFGQRTSQYRGVTRHRWTGRYEAHLWDNSCKKEGQTRKGRQVYLGGYDMEDKAARAYDLAALKYWGPATHINFQLENYHQELEEMKNMSRQEYVAHLRRRSSGFSRGASMYRGVTRHHQHGRWQARIGRVAGNKDLYLGTFSTQEEAAEAYDIAAIKFRGANAVTNFDASRYDVEKIMASNTLPTGEVARRNKGSISIQERPQVLEGSIGISPDWKMVVQNQENATNLNNLQTPISGGLHDLIGSSSGQMMDRFIKPSLANKGSDPMGNVDSWMPLTMAHLPAFAAWNDA